MYICTYARKVVVIYNLYIDEKQIPILTLIYTDKRSFGYMCVRWKCELANMSCLRRRKTSNRVNFAVTEPSLIVYICAVDVRHFDKTGAESIASHRIVSIFKRLVLNVHVSIHA